ncbi:MULTISPECIES: hypothetical protein [Streptomyces]|uniref:hypothetical protein n=1 Tax=Streptomyces TaxID=1883 RepID=UPI001D0B9F02|nr:hypothetical protein [Streptomyces longhuiensis]UDM01538.1 hypothetical protein LGI35_26355 [Streptomyces longhuiensis]
MEDTGSRDERDWLEQPEPALDRTQFTDPVRTVWQLPRFRLGGRRFSGRVDNALVFVTRKGSYETFLPPHRPTTVRRYVALYEVSTELRSFQLRVPLPSAIDSFEFEVTADVTWRVVDPERFVASQEDDVPGLLTRALLPAMRRASREHTIDASAAAEMAVQRAVDTAAPAGDAQGLRTACSIRLRRDAAERSHQSRLRTARHEAEAALPEHRVSVMRQEHEAQIRAEKIKFYEYHLTKGGTAALALHLTEHPDDTHLVLEHLRSDQAALIQTQLHLIDQALEGKGLESYQLEEPRKLIAERMTAILRAPATAEETPPTYPQSPAEAPPEAGA